MKKTITTIAMLLLLGIIFAACGYLELMNKLSASIHFESSVSLLKALFLPVLPWLFAGALTVFFLRQPPNLITPLLALLFALVMMVIALKVPFPLYTLEGARISGSSYYLPFQTTSIYGFLFTFTGARWLLARKKPSQRQCAPME